MGGKVLLLKGGRESSFLNIEQIPERNHLKKGCICTNRKKRTLSKKLIRKISSHSRRKFCAGLRGEGGDILFAEAL